MMRFSSKKRIVLYSILFFLVILAAAVPDDTDPNAPAVILYDIVQSIKQHTARNKQDRPIYFFDQDFSCMKNCFFRKALP